MTFNINSSVVVTLRQPGVELWERSWRDFGVEPPPWNVGETREMQLHEVMHVFGPKLVIGCDPPIETEIELSVPSTISYAAA